MKHLDLRTAGINIILFSVFFICLFCYETTLIFPVFYMDIYSKGILFCLLILLGCICIRDNIYNKFLTCHVDSICLFLIIQVILYVLLALYYAQTYNLTHQLSMIVAFLTYFWFINYSISQKRLIRWMQIFMLVIGVQVFIVFFHLIRSGFSMYIVKSMMVIPVGASNYITTFVICLLPLIYKLEERKWLANFFLILSVIIILLCQSNSALIAFTIEILLLFLFDKKNYFIRIFLMVSFMIFLIFLIKNEQSEYLLRFTKSLNRLISFDSYKLNQVSNNRFELWRYSFDIWLQNPILGIGYVADYSMAHNWVLERLLSGGLVSLFLFVQTLILIYIKAIKSLRHNIYAQICLITITSTLIQGLFEPSFDTLVFNFILWLVIGFCIHKIKYMEKKNVSK